MGAELRVDERAVRRWMVRLDALRLIELRSKLRARTRATSVIAWRADGPLRRLYEKQVREEFLQSTFLRSGEALYFLSAELSDASCKVLLRKMQPMAGEFRDLADLDRTVPARDKHSVATLLGVRPWAFSVFQTLRALPGQQGGSRSEQKWNVWLVPVHSALRSVPLRTAYPDWWRFRRRHWTFSDVLGRCWMVGPLTIELAR